MFFFETYFTVFMQYSAEETLLWRAKLHVYFLNKVLLNDLLMFIFVTFEVTALLG